MSEEAATIAFSAKWCLSNKFNILDLRQIGMVILDVLKIASEPEGRSRKDIQRMAYIHIEDYY